MLPAIARCIGRAHTDRWWGEVKIPVPDKPTEFEKKVMRLGLAGNPVHVLFYSPALKEWAKKHRTKRYVPEYLLKAWGMDVWECDVNICIDRG